MGAYLLPGLRILHVLFAAAWFGAGLTLPGDMRRTIDCGPPHTQLLWERVRRISRLACGAGWMTIATGVALVQLAGGFRRVNPKFHAALGLSLVLVAVGGLLVNTTWHRISRLLETGDLALARRLAKRFGFFNGVGHLLWLTMLGLMVLPF